MWRSREVWYVGCCPGSAYRYTGSGFSSGPVGLEAAVIERMVGPSQGERWERTRSSLRKIRLTFQHPFGVVFKQAFLNKVTIVLHPAGLYSQIVTLRDHTHCYRWLESTDEAANYIKQHTTVRNRHHVGGTELIRGLWKGMDSCFEKVTFSSVGQKY